MNDKDHNYLAEASKLWSAGNTVDSGRLIFENLPNQLRPAGAAQLLQLIIKRTCIESDGIREILAIIGDHARWKESHAIFMLLRGATLEIIKHKSSPPGQSLILAVVGLAEDVAKVTYNASGPQDRFDEYAGWYIVSAVKHICDLVGDDAFSHLMWEALFTGINEVE